MAKCSIISIQICRIRLHDKELRACAVRVCAAGHGDGSTYMGNIVLHTIIGKFSFDLLICSAGSVALRIATLDHKSIDDPVESKPVIKVILYQFNKVGYSDRGCIRIQFHIDLSVVLHCDCCMVGTSKLLAGIDHCSSCCGSFI